MTTTTNPTSPANVNSNLPTPVTEYSPPGDLLVQTRDAIAFEGGAYPSFGGPSVGYYNKDLEGLPFVFSSEIVLRNQPANTLNDGRTIPAQEVAQAWIRMLDDAMEPQPSILATFNGRYLVNQVRNATRDDLVHGGIFTVARNPQFKAINGSHPYMLKRYEHGLDQPPVSADEDSPFGLPQNVQTRITEIEQAGAVPPDYWQRIANESSLSRAEFISEVAKLGLTIKEAMEHMGVKSLNGMNLRLALAQLQQATGK